MTTRSPSSSAGLAVPTEARNEARFRLIFDQAPLGIVLADPATRRILRANPYFANILGRSQTELEGLDWTRHIHSDDLEDIHADHARLIVGELATYTRVQRYLRPDGAEVWVNMTASLVKTGPHEGPQELILLEDITQRRAMEVRLRASEEKFRALVETTSDCIWEVDAQLRFTYLSPRFEEQLGYLPADFLGKTPLELLPEEDKTQTGERLIGLFTSQKPFFCQNVVCHHRLGYPIAIEISGIPFFSAGGHFLGIRGISRDITRRNETEEQLRLSEERHRLIAENADDVIWTMGLDGRFTYVSPSVFKLRGFAVAEVMTQSWADIFSPESLNLVQTQFHDFLSRMGRGEPPQAVHLELAQIRRDGSLVWTDVLASPLIGLDGQFQEILGVTRNIDARKRAEMEIQRLNDTLEQRVAERTAQLAAEIRERQRTEVQLRASEGRYRELNDNLEREVAARTAEAQAANAAKSEFLAQMSHEIRTPLYSMLGLAQLINREPLSAQQGEMVGRLQSAGESLLGILNDILDLAKIEASHLQIDARPFDLPALLQRLAHLYGPSALQKGLLLSLKVPPLPPSQLEGDSLRLEQILGNLISNAIKFTERGEILLQVEVIETLEQWLRLRFTIQDTGIGIAPAILNNLFKPFVQGEGGHSRRYGGTGLGLAISKRLVEMMNGEIGVDSQPGKGSRFWVELPFRRTAVPLVEPVTAVLPWEAQGTPLSGLRVLVVDDSADHRDLMDQALRLEGAEVSLARDGTQAIAILKAHPDGHDLVLMDLQMPVMDGFTATRLIRDELGLNDLPIIALTAGVLPEQRKAAFDAGVDEVLTKPIDLDQIAARLSIRVPPQAGATNTVLADPRDPSSPLATPARAVRDPDPSAGFPDIAGIDRRQVEKHLDGNRAIFLKLLGGFASQFNQVMAEVRADLDQDHREAAAGRIHRLRGYAMSIGALGLGQQAGMLEDAIRQGEPALAESLNVLEHELVALLAAIAPWATAAGGHHHGGPEG